MNSEAKSHGCMEGKGETNGITLTLTLNPNKGGIRVDFFRFWFRIRLVSEILFFTLYCNKRYGVAVVVSREKYVSYWVSYCLVTVL